MGRINLNPVFLSRRLLGTERVEKPFSGHMIYIHTLEQLKLIQTTPNVCLESEHSTSLNEPVLERPIRLWYQTFYRPYYKEVAVIRIGHLSVSSGLISASEVAVWSKNLRVFTLKVTKCCWCCSLTKKKIASFGIRRLEDQIYSFWWRRFLIIIVEIFNSVCGWWTDYGHSFGCTSNSDEKSNPNKTFFKVISTLTNSSIFQSDNTFF